MDKLIPLSLDKGILLEDTSTILSWNKNRDTLREIEFPEVYEAPRNNKVTLVWRNRVCLDGLNCNITAELTGNEPFRRVRLSTWTPNLDKTVDDNFKRVNHHLEQALGRPPKKERVPFYQIPLLEWRYGEVKITHMIFARFGQYPILTISYHGYREGMITGSYDDYAEDDQILDEIDENEENEENIDDENIKDKSSGI